MKHGIEDDVTEKELPEGTVIVIRGGYRYIIMRRLAHDYPKGFMWKIIDDAAKTRTRHRWQVCPIQPPCPHSATAHVVDDESDDYPMTCTLCPCPEFQ